MSGNVGKLRGLRDTARLLLPQIYHLSDGLPVGGAYEPALAVLRKHPDLSAKLAKKFGSEHPKNINIDKVDKAGADFLRASASGILECLGPVYGLFEEIAIFQEHTLRVMTDLSQSLLAFSLNYTPQLLDAYMGLFVDACKVHILAAKVPRALIIQYYTFAYNHVNETDPPHFTEVSNFIRAFQDAIPRLQAEFQPINSRIGDVLEKIAGPLLWNTLEFARLQGRADAFAWRTQFGTLPGMEESIFPAMERAQQMQEWAFFGILVCPGETNRADVRGLLTLILRKSFKFVIFRKHAEWAHPLMERHVMSVLSSVAKKGNLSWAEKRDVKKVVEKAFGEACDSAMGDHRTHRIWLQQRLQGVFTQLQEDASLIPANVSTILALLCLSRMELEWILLHGGDSLPRSLPISWARSGFSMSQPLKASFPDSSIASLLSIHSDVMQYLQSYQDAIQTGWIWILWEQLQAAVKPLVKQVASSPTLTRHHQPVVRTIETLLDEYSETCRVLLTELCGEDTGDYQAGGCNQKSLRGVQTTEKVRRALASLPNACEIWFTLNCQLFSVRTNVSAQSLDALCGGSVTSARSEALGLTGAAKTDRTAECSIVQELNMASKLAEMVCNVGKELLRAGSLQAVGFQAAKLQAVYEAAVQGPAEHAVHAASFLPALLTFHYNDHPKCHEDHGEVATAIAEKLMGSLILRVRGLLHDLFNLVFSPHALCAKATPLPEQVSEDAAVGGEMVLASQSTTGSMAFSSLAASRKPPLSSVMKSGKDFRSSTDPHDAYATSSSVGNVATTTRGSTFHNEKATLVMSKLTALVEACSRHCAPRSILVDSEQTVFLPLWWLREGVISAFRTFLRQSVWKGKTLQRPSELEAQVSCLDAACGVSCLLLDAQICNDM
uniref:Uncharacterized protein n=1 Tax=Tetraselmis chuii TaxID=63592 RepID=A0A7S1X4R1_9CHLO|mmetsp:Transcript_28766/g.51439  ORF Transcript_28766/g.51439 Transcript_28766/m.51439 type:complete len:893 (+) Transcript_28766:302-2980(+)